MNVNLPIQKGKTRTTRQPSKHTVELSMKGIRKSNTQLVGSLAFQVSLKKPQQKNKTKPLELLNSEVLLNYPSQLNIMYY